MFVGEGVERVTQLGTKRTRIGNKGAQIGNKGTPNWRQTNTLKNYRKTLTSTEIL